ncbi:transcriptional repressor [Candidatus Acetothermia bacterium]|jgi:Fe2+ or Zn2+ uptake regulation protein|nr:transcriptional repressor [Candidatus Acetothermia bacterium]MCI2427924.1 transcriptional repressor [Candidatus Acetothermia bacterium]MCI2427966.1 transcriptional repressor [Candidatus Acetothermia bacterium]
MREIEYQEATNSSLRTAGMRITKQRSLIMEIIHQAEDHLDADEIYRRAKAKKTRLSLSTVYRSLQTFKKLGLIDELHFAAERHHYETKPLSEHHHLVCHSCGKIIEFHQHLSRYIMRNIPEAKDFEITGAEIRISGYCAKCRQIRLSAQPGR